MTTITSGQPLIAEHVKGPWPATSLVTVSTVRKSGRVELTEHPGLVFYSLFDHQGPRKGKLIGHRSGITPTRVRLPAEGEVDALNQGVSMTAPEVVLKVKKPRAKKETPANAPAAPAFTRSMETALGSYSARRNLADLVSEIDLGHYVLAVAGDHQRLGCVIDVEGKVLVCMALGGGEFTASRTDCNAVSIVPAGMLHNGDTVLLQTRDGLWNVIGKEAGGIYEVQHTGTDETAFTPLSGARVVQRKHRSAVLIDLGIYDEKPSTPTETAPEVAPAVVHKEGGLLVVSGTTAQIAEVLREEDATQPAPATGWWRGKGSGPAHWLNDGKALCGRTITGDEPVVIASTDPTDPAFQQNQCVKCQKAQVKRQAQAFAEAIKKTHRVREIATWREGTVPSGEIEPRGKVSVRFDGESASDSGLYSPAELEVRPALTIGDRVVFAGDPLKPATIIGDYSNEGKPLQVKLHYDDGKEGGGHVGNMLRYVALAQPHTPSDLIVTAPVQTVAQPVLEVAVPQQTIQQPLHGPIAELPGTQALGTELALDSSSVEGFDEHDPDPFEQVEFHQEGMNRSGVSSPLGRTTLPWSAIVRSDLNPRKVFDEDALKELAVNIHAKGLKQNLVVRPHPAQLGKFEIAAGERRWRAIGLLVKGFEFGEGEARDWLEVPADWPVPVLLEELTDLELVEVATAENMQRKRMSPLEEARAFVKMIELGGNFDDIAAKTGYARRTVVRRYQIGMNLIPEITEKLESGALTLAQAEVLAAVGQETQKLVWGVVKANPRAYDPAALRKQLRSYTFMVKHAEFPRTWYNGEVAQEDLFGDIDPYFKDAEQALKLQVKHASALADKDVKNGAAFAEVVFDAYTWMYDGPGEKGVVYNIDPRTGLMKRWADMGQPRDGYGRKPEHRAGEVSTPSTKKTPNTVAGAMRQAAEANIPRYGQLVADEAHEAALTRLNNDAHLRQLLFIYASSDYNAPLSRRTPEQNAALDEFVQRSDGLFEIEEQRLVPGENATSEGGLWQALPFLMALPIELVEQVTQSLVMGQIEDTLQTADWLAVAQVAGHPFTLCAEYLDDCNDRAVEEIWDDAGMGSRASTTPEYLRAMLLEDAPKLAAKGFLPRPLRREVHEQ